MILGRVLEAALATIASLGAQCMLIYDAVFCVRHAEQRAHCAICTDRIWGLGRQGYKCINCKLLVHKKCHKLVTVECGRQMIQVRHSSNLTVSIKIVVGAALLAHLYIVGLIMCAVSYYWYSHVVVQEPILPGPGSAPLDHPEQPGNTHTHTCTLPGKGSLQICHYHVAIMWQSIALHLDSGCSVSLHLVTR